MYTPLLIATAGSIIRDRPSAYMDNHKGITVGSDFNFIFKIKKTYFKIYYFHFITPILQVKEN